MAVLSSILRAISSDKSLWVFFVGFLAILFLNGFPVSWGGNEVHYLLLSHSFVEDDVYGELFSAYDETNSKFFIYYLLGSLVQVLGFDLTQIVVTLFLLIMMSLALSFFCKELQLSPPLAFLGSALFFFALDGAYYGGAGISLSTEAKNFAYIGTLFSLTFALRKKWIVSNAFAIFATYCHFLVGGFWTLAAIAIFWHNNNDRSSALKLFGSYVICVLPLVVTLGLERMEAVPEYVKEFEYSLNYIYAAIRNPHHIAPFASMDGITFWIQGFINIVIVASGLLFLRFTISNEDDRRYINIIIGLHAYLVLALIISFIDQKTYLLAAFYMFRPAALTLLLTLLILARLVTRHTGTKNLETRSFLALCALGVVLSGPVTSFLADTVNYKGVSVEAQLSEDERQLVDWIRDNTNADDAFLLSPTVSGDYGPPKWLGFEMYTGRPAVVQFKFVATAKADLAKWYRDITNSRKLLGGDCNATELLPFDYIVYSDEAPNKGLEDCTVEVAAFGNARLLQITR
ncbi:MAG: hypothetical protein CMK09_17530 [Ponticaulis sp.]|nr:hypothetical protein [Ponticaulis sp.]|tara:strand:- start:36411 stop:37958 length:1548 start_codon:yes stop_codon:yes gene_type:complete